MCRATECMKAIIKLSPLSILGILHLYAVGKPAGCRKVGLQLSRLGCFVQDLAKGAASQQKLIDAAAAVGNSSSRAQPDEAAQQRLQSLPAKLTQIQGGADGDAECSAAAAESADRAGDADMGDESDDSEDAGGPGSISSGEDSKMSNEDTDKDADEDEEEAEEATAGTAEVAASAAGEVQAKPGIRGKSPLSH